MKLIAGCLVVLGLLVSGMGAPARAAELTVDLGHVAVRWSTAELLARPDAQTISVTTDVAFKRPMRYRAVPLADLLRGIAPTDHLTTKTHSGLATSNLEVMKDEGIENTGLRAYAGLR